jgi:hypothetical protein
MGKRKSKLSKEERAKRIRNRQSDLDEFHSDQDPEHIQALEDHHDDPHGELGEAERSYKK